MGLRRGEVRVDVAVINGELSGYEIKSPSDTLDRLPRQQAVYSRILDRAWLVTTAEQAALAAATVPPWWGVMTITGSQRNGAVLAVARPSERNPAPEPIAIAELLWRDEALSLLAARAADHGARSKPRRYLWARLADTYELADLQIAVRSTLKKRSGWLPA